MLSVSLGQISVTSEISAFNDSVESKLEPADELIPAGLRCGEDKPPCHPSVCPRHIHLCLHAPLREQQAGALTSENEMKVITP